MGIGVPDRPEAAIVVPFPPEIAKRDMGVDPGGPQRGRHGGREIGAISASRFEEEAVERVVIRKGEAGVIDISSGEIPHQQIDEVAVAGAVLTRAARPCGKARIGGGQGRLFWRGHDRRGRADAADNDPPRIRQASGDQLAIQIIAIIAAEAGRPVGCRQCRRIMVIQKKGIAVRRRLRGKAADTNGAPCPAALPAAGCLAVENKDPPVARFRRAAFILRHRAEGNGVIRQKIAHAAGRHLVRQGNLLLRCEARDKAGGHPRHGDKQTYDQRRHPARQKQHRAPAKPQRVKPEPGQRRAVPDQETKKPDHHKQQDEELDLEQEHRADKKDGRGQPGRRQRRARVPPPVIQLPGQRQHRHHQRDEEPGAPHRHRQRRQRRQQRDQQKLDIPALPAPRRQTNSQAAAPEQHQHLADLERQQPDQRQLPDSRLQRPRQAGKAGKPGEVLCRPHIRQGRAHREPVLSPAA